MVFIESLIEKVFVIEEIKGVIKQGLLKVLDIDENESDVIFKKMKFIFFLRDKFVELQGCSNGKVQISKRKIKDINVFSLFFRFFKRFVGIEVEEVIFYSIFIEYVRLVINMKVSKIKVNYRLDLILNEL